MGGRAGATMPGEVVFRHACKRGLEGIVSSGWALSTGPAARYLGEPEGKSSKLKLLILRFRHLFHIRVPFINPAKCAFLANALLLR